MSPSVQATCLSVITMICWGVSNGLMKVPSIRLGAAKAIRLRQVMMIFTLFLYKFFFEALNFENINWILVSLCLGLFGYIPFYFFCQALRIGSVGIVNSIGNSFPIITAFLSYIILNIPIGNDGIIGIAVTTIGILILSFNRKKHGEGSSEQKHHVKSVLYALIACGFWGAFYTYVPIPNKHLDLITFTFCLQFGTLVSSHIHSLFHKEKNNVSKRTLNFGILAGIFGVSGSLCFYTALHIGNAGIATAIAGSSPVVGAIFGKLVYHEKINKVAFIGILISIFGVGLLSISSH